MVKFHVYLGNSQTKGLMNFWSYPVKTHYIHKGKNYLMVNIRGTDEFSEWQIIHIWAFTLGIHLTFCYGTCDVSTLVWMTMYIYII